KVKAPVLSGRLLVNGERAAIPVKDRHTITDVAFSPDGKQLAVASLGSAMIWIYEPDTGKEGKFLTARQKQVNCVAFSPDGVNLAAGGADKVPNLELWDVATWKPNKALTGHEFPVQSLAFHPKGNQLATGGADKSVRIWNLATGESEALAE